MSTVFLFGAGASYGSGDCNPYPPPLGKHLFPKLQRWGGVASTVESPLREKFINDFEKGMEEFFRHRNIDTTAFLREMAAYFAQFELGPNNHYDKLAKIVGETRGRVVLVTTNYELLLEYAINRAGYPIAYGIPTHYPRGGLPVLKIHGSCNFLPDQEQGARFEGIGFDLSMEERAETPIEDIKTAIYDGPVKPGSLYATRAFCRKNDSMAPALGLYLPGKLTLWCPSFVKRQQELWRKAVQRAGRIYVIGTAIYDHDTHIWDVLAQAKGQLRYVSPDPDCFLEWRERVGRKSARVMAGTFEEALPIIRREMKSR
jgi:hypothetical protein